MKQVTESDAVDVVETAVKCHSFDLTSRAMCLVALLKLSSRFPSSSQYVIPSIFFYMVITSTATSESTCLWKSLKHSVNTYINLVPFDLICFPLLNFNVVMVLMFFFL